MAKRTTIYCNDETEKELNELMSLAQAQPAYWSQVTEQAAPTSVNQLIAALIHLGYSELIGDRILPATPGVALWEAVDAISREVPDEEWSDVPADLATNLDYYLYGGERE